MHKPLDEMTVGDGGEHIYDPHWYHGKDGPLERKSIIRISESLALGMLNAAREANPEAEWHYTVRVPHVRNAFINKGFVCIDNGRLFLYARDESYFLILVSFSL